MKRDKEATDMRNFSCGKSLKFLYLEIIESSEIVEALQRTIGGFLCLRPDLCIQCRRYHIKDIIT